MLHIPDVIVFHQFILRLSQESRVKAEDGRVVVQSHCVCDCSGELSPQWIFDLGCLFERLVGPKLAILRGSLAHFGESCCEVDGDQGSGPGNHPGVHVPLSLDGSGISPQTRGVGLGQKHSGQAWTQGLGP